MKIIHSRPESLEFFKKCKTVNPTISREEECCKRQGPKKERFWLYRCGPPDRREEKTFPRDDPFYVTQSQALGVFAGNLQSHPWRQLLSGSKDFSNGSQLTVTSDYQTAGEYGQEVKKQVRSIVTAVTSTSLDLTGTLAAGLVQQVLGISFSDTDTTKNGTVMSWDNIDKNVLKAEIVADTTMRRILECGE